jgi:chemotaxis protein CheZ
MAEPRKIFRIERMPAARCDEAAETEQAGAGFAEIMQELRSLRSVIAAMLHGGGSCAAAAPERGEVARLTSELNRIAGAIAGEDTADSERDEAGAPLSRVECELNAIVNGTEKATQKILAAAEAIDSTANTLAAALGGRIERELAQDIQDLVIQIFEACNFQDLIGQRVAKVVAALHFVEVQIARVLEEITTASSARALHGPRLEGDHGHASQDAVDAMFANKPMASDE